MIASIELPIHLTVGVRNPKRVPLNLNHYRNAHHHTLDSMKKAFKKEVTPFLTFPKINVPVQLTYTLYPRTRHRMDISNVLSVVDKYFCDAVTEAGLWVDDSYEWLPKVVYTFGEVDKNNPRAKVLIEEI